MCRTNSRRYLIAAVFAMSLLGSQRSYAFRYVKFEIMLDKKIVLMTSKGDSGHEDANTMWGYLNELELRSVNGYKVKPTKSPLRAVLKGKISIDCNNDHAASVTISHLNLVRSKTGGAWKVDPQDVKRMQKMPKKVET